MMKIGIDLILPKIKKTTRLMIENNYLKKNGTTGVIKVLLKINKVNHHRRENNKCLKKGVMKLLLCNNLKKLIRLIKINKLINKE